MEQAEGVAPSLSERQVARLISAAERGESDLGASPSRRRAHVVGVTGPPGSGKSTLVDVLVAEVRAGGSTVAVLAIDPSSPVTGGAVLGDRVRMSRHATDPGVYIRSMGTRGAVRGLAAAARDAVRVLDTAGYDLVVVETVGVGQVELDVMGLADTVVVVTVPGLGDTMQMNKAGLMEIADVFAVNMADRPETGRHLRELKQALAIGRRHDDMPPVCPTVALTGEGVPRLREAVLAHYAAMQQDDALVPRRRAQLAAEVRELAQAQMRFQVDAQLTEASAAGLFDEVWEGSLTPRQAASRLVHAACTRGSATPARTRRGEQGLDR